MTMETTMKTIKLGASLGCLLGCVLATMVACSPDIPSSKDAGSNESGKRDAGTGTGTGSRDAGVCTSARAAILGAACATCVETNCQTIMASCNADNCTRCLLGCTTCLTACTPDSGISGGGGVPSGGDGGTPSCDKIRNANCCAIAAAVNMEAQCQQAVDANNDAICATLLTQTQNFAGRCQ